MTTFWLILATIYAASLLTDAPDPTFSINHFSFQLNIL